MVPQKTLCSILSVSVVILFIIVLIQLYINFQTLPKEDFINFNGNADISKMQNNIIKYLRGSKNKSLSFLEKDAKKDIKESRDELDEIKQELMIEPFYSKKKKEGMRELEEFNTMMGSKLNNLFGNNDYLSQITRLENELNTLDRSLRKRASSYKPEKFLLTHKYDDTNNKMLRLACMEVMMGKNNTKLFVIPQTNTGNCLLNDDGDLTLYNCNGLFTKKENRGLDVMQGLLFKVEKLDVLHAKYIVSSFLKDEIDNVQNTYYLTISKDDSILKLTTQRDQAISFVKEQGLVN